jgi:hypothetical protein
MILHDQLPTSPKNRHNGKMAWSHTKEIVEKHDKKCLQQKTLNELIWVEIKTTECSYEFLKSLSFPHSF